MTTELMAKCVNCKEVENYIYGMECGRCGQFLCIKCIYSHLSKPMKCLEFMA